MWLGVLGPLRCEVAGNEVRIAGRLGRALLAALAVDRSQPTGVDELAEAMWGGHPPRAATKVVRNRVSSLRAALTPTFVRTAGTGYRLDDAVVVDADCFERDVGSASERLALWRGAPFGDVALWGPARAAATRLVDLRAHLEELTIAEKLDGDLDPGALVGRLEQLVEAEPFRERRWALLMRALYLAGRQHEALRAFHRARLRLRDELGLSPGAELLAIEQAVLNHDPALGRTTRPARAPSELIGRRQALDEVCALLDRSRLVTLTGLGGVGKSTLARQVLALYPVASTIVDLSQIDDGGDVAGTVARALQLAVVGDARRAVGSWSSRSSSLLLLDNSEHVRDDVRDLADIVLTEGADVSVLVTSRIPIAGRSEAVYQVRPLARADSVELYRTRAHRHRRSTDEIDEIESLCGLLGDIPLAIELAAARSPVLSASDMVCEFAAAVSSPASSAPADQRRAGTEGDVVSVVTWATQALSADAARLFRRCAVFPGGFTLHGARAVLGDDSDMVTDAFSELAEASMIDVRFDGGTRYLYLDLVRFRAFELLDANGERTEAEKLFVAWAVGETQRITYDDLPRLLAELPNLVAAARAACARGDVDAALRITAATFVLEKAERCELLDSKVAALRLPGAGTHPRYTRSCAEAAHTLLVLRGDLTQARHFAEIALERDPNGRSAGWALHTLGHLEGNLDHMRRALSLARRWRDPMLQFYASSVLIENAGPDDEAAKWALVRANDRLAATIDKPWATIMASLTRGEAHFRVQPEAALIHLRRAAQIAERHGLTVYATVARALVADAGPTTDPATLIELSKQGFIQADRAGVSFATVLALSGLARIFQDLGQPDHAALLAGAARARFKSSTEQGPRLRNIDREEHLEHQTLYDVGTTMDTAEIVAAIHVWTAESRQH